jgi:hypothetical protein
MANDIGKDVEGVLLFLGFLELRGKGGGWMVTEGAASAYGTTDETLILHRKHHATATLVDRGTGEVVGEARRSCPLQEVEPVAEETLVLAGVG